jgi:hypothetical protein
MQLHHVGVRVGQGESRSDTASRTDRAEQISAVVSLVSRLCRPRFRAEPIGARGHSSGRSGPRPHMRVPCQVKAVASSERPFAPSRHRRLDWDRVHSSERCITLHTVPVAGALTDPDRRPQCLMHETSTPDGATHLERGSMKLPKTKTVVSSNRSPRSRRSKLRLRGWRPPARRPQ